MKGLSYIFFLLLALLSAVPSSAQKKLETVKPDLNAIKEATLDPASPFYYPRLEKIYESNDTLMTPEQYRYFYLGAMFREDYNPYRKTDFQDHTDSLLRLNRVAIETRDSTLKAKVDRKESPFELERINKQLQMKTLREQKEIVVGAEQALKDNPFDLQSMYMLTRILKDMRKDMSAKIWEYRLENILGAIVSSGTGLDTDNAWYVISPDHEYFLLEVLGFDVDDYEFIEPGFDYLKITPSETRRSRTKIPDGYFFNVVVPIEQYNRKWGSDVISYEDESSYTETTPEDVSIDLEEILDEE